MKKKKVMRKTKFVDIPVTPKTRDLVRSAKKKTGSKTFDELMQKTFKDIIGTELM